MDGFEGYYRVPQADRDNAYRDGLIVLDANALLDLYRLTPAARAEMFSLLRALAPRLFVLHQVATEFHRRRLDAVAGRRQEFQEQIRSVDELANSLRGLIRRVAQRAHGRVDEAAILLGYIEEAFTKGREFITQVANDYDMDPDLLAGKALRSHTRTTQ